MIHIPYFAYAVALFLFHYRPQTKLGQGNIFTPVCHSFHRGGACMVAGGAWLPEGHAWLWGGVHRIRRDTVNERAVRILLECILVFQES